MINHHFYYSYTRNSVLPTDLIAYLTRDGFNYPIPLKIFGKQQFGNDFYPIALDFVFIETYIIE